MEGECLSASVSIHDGFDTRESSCQIILLTHLVSKSHVRRLLCDAERLLKHLLGGGAIKTQGNSNIVRAVRSLHFERASDSGGDPSCRFGAGRLVR